MSDSAESAAAVRAASLAGLVLVAIHVAAKATNDALFLSNFPVSALPTMLVVAALVSLGVVLAAARAMSALGPGRLVPGAFAGSAGLLLLVWALLGFAPKVAAVLLFLEITAVGAVLISGFWSLVNERFDPHAAKKSIARIALSSAAGGVAGGLVATGVAAGSGLDAMLPLLAAGHLFCAWRVLGLRSPAVPAPGRAGPAAAGAERPPSGWHVLARNAYLRHLGLFVLLAGVTAALLDYLFKSFAAARFSDPETLLRFFSGYYLAVGFVSLLAQSLFSRAALDKLGVARASALLPCATAAGAAGVLFLPGLAAAGLAAFAEAVLSNSIFRSAYELFYVPVPAREKRAVKTIVDVGLRRLADAGGGGLTRVILLAGPHIAAVLLAALAAGLSLAALALAAALRRGYVLTLSRGLRERAGELDLGDLDDALSRSVVLQVSGEWKSGAARRAPEAPAPAPTPPESPWERRRRILRAGDAAQIRALLAEGIPAELAPQVLRLLARDDLAPLVLRALNREMPALAGELHRALADPNEEFTVRRRLPYACRRCDDPRAIDLLLAGLEDPRFETRFHCARVLSRLHRRNPQVPPADERVRRALLAELDAPRELRDGRQVLDDFGAFAGSLFVDPRPGRRAAPALEFIFALLSLALDPEPLRIAFRALHVDDRLLRGTALEYLSADLPVEIGGKLLALLEAAPAAAADPAAARDQLLRSVPALEAHLSAARRGRPAAQ